MTINSLRKRLRQLSVLGLGGCLAITSSPGAAEVPPGPIEREFSIATVSTLLRPLTTRRLYAPMSGKFILSPVPGLIAAGDTVGHFDDADLRTATEISRLRLGIARQEEADALTTLPARRQEIRQHIAELETRLSLAEAVTKDPALLAALPAATQAPLIHADPAAFRAQVEAAKAQAARLDAVDYADTSPARLQVLEAERAAREAGERLRESVVAAPIAGVFQPSAALMGSTAPGVMLGTGQEIGTMRDLTRLVAAVPALSPYLVRADIERTFLHIEGPGGRPFTARFREAVTENSPATGETRVFLYEFSPADSQEIASMVQTNISARILFVPEQPVAIVDKLQAALDHPGSFRAGWGAGAARIWPEWTILCEGETALALVRVKP